MVKHFSHYENLKNPDSLILSYAGPKFPMLNITAICTKGVELNDERVYNKCEESNFRDPHLDLWEEKGNVTDNVILDPQIIKTKNFIHIYCPYDNITIDGENIY